MDSAPSGRSLYAEPVEIAADEPFRVRECMCQVVNRVFIHGRKRRWLRPQERAEHSVDEPGFCRGSRALREANGLIDGGTGRHSLEIAYLVEPDAQSLHDVGVRPRERAPSASL
jgi:hypothetical protein